MTMYEQVQIICKIPKTKLTLQGEVLNHLMLSLTESF